MTRDAVTTTIKLMRHNYSPEVIKNHINRHICKIVMHGTDVLYYDYDYNKWRFENEEKY